MGFVILVALIALVVVLWSMAWWLGVITLVTGLLVLASLS
jgi:hypothetical protein